MHGPRRTSTVMPMLGMGVLHDGALLGMNG